MLPFVVSQSKTKARAEDFTSKSYSLTNSLSHPTLLEWFCYALLSTPIANYHAFIESCTGAAGS